MSSSWGPFLSQMKTISNSCRCKALPLAAARSSSAAGELAARPAVVHTGLSQLAGRRRRWFPFVLRGPIPNFTPMKLLVLLLHLGTCCSPSSESNPAGSGPFLKFGCRPCCSSLLLCWQVGHEFQPTPHPSLLNSRQYSNTIWSGVSQAGEVVLQGLHMICNSCFAVSTVGCFLTLSLGLLEDLWSSSC